MSVGCELDGRGERGREVIDGARAVMLKRESAVYGYQNAFNEDQLMEQDEESRQLLPIFARWTLLLENNRLSPQQQ